MKRYQPTFSSRVLRGLLLSSVLTVCSVAAAQAPAEDDVEISVEANPASTPTPPSPASDVPAAAPEAPAPVSAQELTVLRAQLAAVEARLAQNEAAAASQTATLADERRASEVQRAKQEKESLLTRIAKAGVSISGYVQVQYGQSQLSEDEVLQGGTPLNQDRFSVRRGRLRVNGRWQYFRTDFELDASTTRGPSTSVRRASVSGVYPSKIEGELPYVLATVGLTEIPLGLELQQGQDDILFLERTTGSLAFFSGPVDTGAKVEGAYGPLRLQFAIMNGAPLDDRAGGPSAVDPTRAPDYLGRAGVDVKALSVLQIAGGISLLTGTGFHAGSDATKPVLQWNDSNADGSIGAGELVSVAGRGATPSSTFEHWAVGADLALALTTKIGVSRLYGEFLLAENLDRALYVADPEIRGIDMRELAWYAALVQDVTEWGFVGLRYDVYDPNSDLFESRRGKAVPRDASYQTISPILGARWPGFGRLTFQYDVIKDHLARDSRGVPTDVKNNTWTLRLQGRF